MSDKLSHLTEKEIEELIKRYYENEKISDLINEYNISLTPSQLVRHFPPEITNIKCIYCDVNMVRTRQSRNYSYKNEAVCPECGHTDTEFCYCNNCMEIELKKQEEQRQEKQKILNDILSINETNKVDFDTLTFTEKVYLGALLREGISEDYNYIKPISDFINPLAPTSELQSEIINHLIDREIILIHPNTDTEHIEIIDLEKGNIRYYTYKVKWFLNVKKDDLNKVPLIEEIINPEKLTSDNKNDALKLWKKIALNEALEYFIHSIKNILGIEYNIGEKTISVLKDLLNDYSVSQIYGIIYKSTNNALRFQAERMVSRKHSANTIIGNAQSYGERAKINKWELIKYNRIKECPESALSKFFFERIIKIGYNGFNDIPRIEMIKSYQKQKKESNMKEILSKLFENSIELEYFEISKKQKIDKWIGNPPATKTEIKMIEEKFNITLPNDYTEMLLISNGFPALTSIEPNFEKIENIIFYKDYEYNVIDAWKEENNPDDITEILKRSIIIGGINEEQQFLLVPPNNENEKWRYLKFATWMLGEREYATLREYFRDVNEFIIDEINERKQ